jgi:hypothetical protein
MAQIEKSAYVSNVAALGNSWFFLFLWLKLSDSRRFQVGV